MKNMKITMTPDISAFFQRGMANLQNERKNAFLGRRVSAANERQIQRQMAAAGFAQFQGPPEQWPSLFLSAEAWQKSPYHSHIHLQDIQTGGFSYETETLQANELFNADAIQPDPNRELNDSMLLKALDQPCPAVFLYQNDDVWMMDAPSEAATNDAPAAQAHGRVLTFGLGIGYFIYMAMQNPAVQEITVVESSPAVIQMFQQDLLPQFPKKIPLRIRQGDAFQLWQADYLQQFDFVYADIWQSSDDGLRCMQRLLRQYHPPLAKAAFWIENSCLETVWTLVFLHFRELAAGQIAPIAPEWQPLMKQVRTFFQSLSRCIDKPQQLKDLIYSRAVLRAILAGQSAADLLDQTSD